MSGWKALNAVHKCECQGQFNCFKPKMRLQFIIFIIIFTWSKPIMEEVFYNQNVTGVLMRVPLTVELNSFTASSNTSRKSILSNNVNGQTMRLGTVRLCIIGRFEVCSYTLQLLAIVLHCINTDTWRIAAISSSIAKRQVFGNRTTNLERSCTQTWRSKERKEAKLQNLTCHAFSKLREIAKT